MRAFALSFLLLVCAWVALPTAPAQAQDRKRRKDEPVLPVPPPQPVEQKVAVPRDGSLDVTLKIYGRQIENLRFLVRARPAKGKLSAPTQTGRETASITYQPPADLSVKSETFSYAVQNSKGVSAPATVTIAIVDDPVRLIVPDHVKFPPILAGQTAQQEIKISNEGGSLAEGEVLVDEPWQVAGARDYRLGQGESKTFTVVFAPQNGGPAKREVRYSSHPDRVTTLVGEAQTPITVQPAILQLQHEAGDPVRAGVVEITNHTEQPQTVYLQPSERLQVPAREVALPPGGKEMLAVKLAGDDTRAFREELIFSGAGVQMKVAVAAPTLPAMLRTETNSVRLPVDIVGRTTGGRLAMKNIGGEAGYWQVSAEPPFAVSPAEVRLPAGGEAVVNVQLQTGEPGDYTGVVRFTGEQQTVEVKLQAEARMVSSAPSTASRPTAASTASLSPTQSVAASEPAAAPSTRRSGSPLPGIDEDAFRRGAAARLRARVEEVTANSVKVRWSESLTGGKGVQVAYQQLSLDEKRKLKVEWITLPPPRLEKVGDQVRAEVVGLPQANRYSLLFSTVDPTTQAVKPAFTLDFGPPKHESVLRPTTGKLVVLLVVVLGAVGFWRWRKTRAAAGG